MKTEISYEFLFDAAHHFPTMPDGHKYNGIHGHSFRVEVAVVGEPDTTNGFVVDLEGLEQACEALRARLDHGLLNNIEGLERPSLENIARWVWERLKPKYSGLGRVTVRRDSCRQGCTYFEPATSSLA
ncbi:MAG TPA: 6-carboxytetrahydropterin synthase [Usitatibacter sp.]|nr:6-carboxytetrahydropterin synthase [Usitatibacter sp.]